MRYPTGLDFIASLSHLLSVIAVACCLFAAYLDSYYWTVLAFERRVALGLLLFSGALSAYLHTMEWWHIWKADDYADRFPLMWIPRLLHVGTGFFQLVADLYFNSWKWSFILFCIPFVNCPAGTFRQFYLGSHILEQEKKANKKK